MKNSYFLLLLCILPISAMFCIPSETHADDFVTWSRPWSYVVMTGGAGPLGHEVNFTTSLEYHATWFEGKTERVTFTLKIDETSVCAKGLGNLRLKIVLRLANGFERTEEAEYPTYVGHEYLGKGETWTREYTFLLLTARLI